MTKKGSLTHNRCYPIKEAKRRANKDTRRVGEHTEFNIAEIRWNMLTGWVHDLLSRLSRGHALEITLWGIVAYQRRGAMRLAE